MTKGEIDRLGEKIRSQSPSISEGTLQQLQDYRVSHKDALSTIFNNLCALSKKVSKNSIVTYRIKRFESIIGKLNRYPKMNFSRMWDIGGCRCILNNDIDVYKLKKLINQHPLLKIKKEYDYIKAPQSEGYKALHLFVDVENSNLTIEVQIRNRNDHNWATLVEITDFLFEARLKEYSEDKELLQFHYLLSKRKELISTEKEEIADTIKKYNYFDKLSQVFTRNYIQVRKQWLEIESKSEHKYFLIETKKDEIPKISSFYNFNQAEETYFKVYKTSGHANIVLTHLPTPSYSQISIAYSNYILTFHSFLDDCYEIFESLLAESIENGKYLKFIKYFELYNSIVFNHISNLLSEIFEVTKISQTNSQGKKSKLRIKEKEWISDINLEIKKRQEKAAKLQKLFRTNAPSNFIMQYAFRLKARSIHNKYQKRLNKIYLEKSKAITN